MHQIDIESILLTITPPPAETLDTTNWGQASTLDMIGQFFFLIFVFAGVVVLAYYSTKWIASAKHLRRGGNLSLIESMSIGHQSAVALVKAGGKVLLIGITKENIAMLSEIEEDEITVPEQKQPALTTSFEKHLKKYFIKTEDVNGQHSTTTLKPTNKDKQ